jgi:hypothetical protein
MLPDNVSLLVEGYGRSYVDVLIQPRRIYWAKSKQEYKKLSIIYRKYKETENCFKFFTIWRKTIYNYHQALIKS